MGPSMSYPSPTLKNVSINEEKFLNLLSMLENEFSFEDRVKCLRFVFDKMIEQRQQQIKECEGIVQNLTTEIITIRREFETLSDTGPMMKQHG